MGTNHLRVSALAALLVLTGCGVRRAPVLVPPPFWIDNEERPDGLGATGLAQANPQGDLALQRTQALADARGRLSAKVRTRARNLCARLRLKVLASAADGTHLPVDPQVTRQFTQGVLKHLGATPLEGVATSAFWEDPANRTLYVFATLSRASLSQALGSAVQAQLRVMAGPGGPLLTLAPGTLADALSASNP